MTNTAKRLGQATMDVGGNTVYTVGVSTTAILKSFDICNTSASLIKVRVHLVPSGGSAATSNAILYDYPIVANGTFGWEGEQVLPTGASIRVAGNVAGCTITASGVEIT